MNTSIGQGPGSVSPAARPGSSGSAGPTGAGPAGAGPAGVGPSGALSAEHPGGGTGRVDEALARKGSVATLVKVSVPDLPPVNQETLDLSRLDAEGLLAVLGIDSNRNSIRSSESDVRANQVRQKKAFENRMNELEKAIQSAEKARAKENSFWGKFCKVLSVIGSVVASVASMVVASALASTGIGAPFAVLLMAQAVTGLASAVMDSLVALGAFKDPGWRPTLGSGITEALKAMHVPDNVAGWIGIGLEAAVSLTAGAGAMASVAKKAAEVAKGLGQATKEVIGKAVNEALKQMNTATTQVAKWTQVGAAVTQAGAQGGAAAINLQAAGWRKEEELASARAEEFKASIQRLAKALQMDTELIQAAVERIQGIFQASTEIVQGVAEANRTVSANLGGATPV